VGRRVPVGARRLSACAKTLSNSRDAFIALLLRNNLESQFQKPKFALRCRVRCHQRIGVASIKTPLRTTDASEQLVFEKRHDWRRLESFSAFEEFQLNQKLRLDQIRPSVSDKLRRGG